MTEAEARNLLRAHQDVGGLEPWIAEQPWRPAPGELAAVACHGWLAVSAAAYRGWLAGECQCTWWWNAGDMVGERVIFVQSGLEQRCFPTLIAA
jgi:hypothetical protein